MKIIINLKLKAKKAFVIIVSILPSILGIGLSMNAQSSDILLNSEWRLDESNINGVSISTTNLGAAVFYSPDNEDFFLNYYGLNCFEDFKTNFSDVTESSFNLSTIFEYNACNFTDPDEIEAVELYQSFYFEMPLGVNSSPKNPFTYHWVDNGLPVEDLVITNPDGDWLLYRRPYLSVPTFKTNSFVIYPNPTSNFINIKKLDTTTNITNIKIYNVLGNLVQFENKIENNPEISIAINQLNNGLYFMTIEDIEGSKQTLKFIKK